MFNYHKNTNQEVSKHLVHEKWRPPPPPFLLSIESCSIFLTTLQDCLDAHFPARPLISPLVCSLSRSLAHLPAHWLICPLVGSFARSLAHLPACWRICPPVGSFACSFAHLSTLCGSSAELLEAKPGVFWDHICPN